jgi:hypothetical protein
MGEDQPQQQRMEISQPRSTMDPSFAQWVEQSEDYLRTQKMLLEGKREVFVDGVWQMEDVKGAKPLLNAAGVAYIMGEARNILRKENYLMDMPLERFFQASWPKVKAIASHLFINSDEFELQPGALSVITAMVCMDLQAAYFRSIGNKERDGLYPTVKQTYTNQPQGNASRGLLDRLLPFSRGGGPGR